MQSKKEHKEKKLQMVSRWQQSGLTQKAFCAADNIPYHVFHYWYGVYRSDLNSNGSFLPVNITSADIGEQITVTGLSGIKLQFEPTKQSVDFIKQLLLS